MDILKKQLEKVSKPSLEMPLHQARLRRALMRKFESRPSLLTMLFPKLLPAGLALALVFSIGSAFIKAEQKITPTVSAAEIVNDAIEKVQNLSDAELEEIRIKMSLSADSEIMSTLESAKNASDLSLVSPINLSCSAALELADSGTPALIQTFSDQEPSDCSSAVLIHFGPDTYSTNGFDLLQISNVSENLSYLEYTKDGVRNVLALDEENLPVMTMNYTPAPYDGASATIYMDGESSN